MIFSLGELYKYIELPTLSRKQCPIFFDE